MRDRRWPGECETVAGKCPGCQRVTRVPVIKTIGGHEDLGYCHDCTPPELPMPMFTGDWGDL